MIGDLTSLYGQLSPLIVETDTGEVVTLSCSGSFTNFGPSGAITLCTINFTLAADATVFIDASGTLTSSGAGGAHFHQLWVQVDAVSPPTFSADYVPADAPASASLSASIALLAGAHSVQLKYFSQTTGLGSDSGKEQISIRYSK